MNDVLVFALVMGLQIMSGSLYSVWYTATVFKFCICACVSSVLIKLYMHISYLANM